ncbi:hypothetical protein T01_8312 [Trichinella spiralis]|uniref:Uncharacterized protein n=1 Tax=Trichinella spiralis TaxID=6334 RepID=A0A0V1AIR1_TRISP|nr:hypothetical protein T01_8312 [Trichinella spiralis]
MQEEQTPYFTSGKYICYGEEGIFSMMGKKCIYMYPRSS